LQAAPPFPSCGFSNTAPPSQLTFPPSAAEEANFYGFCYCSAPFPGKFLSTVPPYTSSLLTVDLFFDLVPPKLVVYASFVLSFCSTLHQSPSFPQSYFSSYADFLIRSSRKVKIAVGECLRSLERVFFPTSEHFRTLPFAVFHKIP